MKTRTAFLMLAALLLALPRVGTAQSTIEGAWILTLNSPEGTNTVPLVVREAAGEVTAVFGGAPDGPTLFSGSREGNEVEFFWALDYNGMALEITMTGELRNGVISGMADFSGLAQGDWTFRRPESAPPG